MQKAKAAGKAKNAGKGRNAEKANAVHIKHERVRIVITGTPGTGKSRLARVLGKKYGVPVVNDNAFAVQYGLGKKILEIAGLGIKVSTTALSLFAKEKVHGAQKRKHFPKNFRVSTTQPFLEKGMLPKVTGFGKGMLPKNGTTLEVDVQKFRKKFLQAFAGKSFVAEGHLFCEFAIPRVDVVVVLRCNPKLLEKRLHKRGYAEVKVQDNLACELAGYCGRKAGKFYGKVREVRNEKAFKAFQSSVLAILRRHLKARERK